MAELVALLLPAGDLFLDTLQRVWEAGDAVLPLDPAAPEAHTRRILDSLAPGAVIGPDGERRGLSGGMPVEPGDAVVIATSGTTGVPKGAVHTHEGIAAAARMTAASPTSDGRAPRWLACLPLAHVGGFSVLTRALLNGAGLVVHERPDARAIDDAARQGATHVSLVPTLLGRIDPTLWEVILLGGSTVGERRPANSVATYGMTETFGGVVYDGRPLAGVDVRVVFPDGDGAGRIELRSPSLLRSYRTGADSGPGAVGTDPRDDGGWYRTGDIGSIAEDGTLSVHGRGDDLIITGGVKVWPAPVEDVLRRDPTVADVAVIGVPDPEWGQRVVALVVPVGGVTAPTLSSLRRRVRDELPAAAAPKEIRLVDVLPRTQLGKLARHMLDPGTAVTEHGEAEPTVAS